MATNGLRPVHDQEFLDALERLDQSLHSSTNLDEVLKNTLDLALDTFETDRTYLLHPADPDAGFYRILMECTRPEYPGAGISKEPVPIDPGTRMAIVIGLQTMKPIALGTPEAPVPPVLKERFGVLSQLASIVMPNVGKPWILGMQQCSRERIWTEREVTLFTEFTRRVGDGLGTLLLLRDLERNEEDLRITLDAIADGVIATSAAGLVTRLNPVAASLTGISAKDSIGRHIDEVVPFVGDASPFSSVLGNTEAIPYKEVELERPGEERFFVAISHAPIRNTDDELVGTVAVIRDLREPKRLEKQLLANEKLNAIGLMASGIAHDFNNQLTVIQGFAELMMLRSSENSKYTTAIAQAASNASRLTQQLLLLSRKTKRELTPVDCHAAINRIIGMLKRSADKRIEISASLKAETATVRAVPSEMENALLNLGLNACDAMKRGGTLVFETGLEEIKHNSVLLDTSGIVEGTYVKITVTDTGEGIPTERLGRVFEPFYTTKPLGKGTGLGLATVRAFVDNAAGAIKLYSEQGKGTTFSLFLPVSKARPEHKVPSNQPPPSGSGTVLIVDDEPVVRLFVANTLESLGYETIKAGSAREAIEFFKTTTSEISLILLDVMLPEMSGLEALTALKSVNDSVPILLMSGFTELHIEDILEKGRADGFLSKPFSVQTLARSVATALSDD